MDTREEPVSVAQGNAKISMSPAVARDAPLPLKGDYILWDRRTRYLGLRIYAGGARVWFVQKKLGKAPCKVKLGDFPEMTYTKACSLVAEVVAKISKGVDPNLEKRQQIRETAEARRQESFTVVSCFEAYLANKEDPSNKPKTNTITDLKRALERLKSGSLGSVPLIGLTGGLLDAHFQYVANKAKRHNTNNGRTQAGRDMRYLRAAYNYCAEKYSLQLPEKNPFLSLNKLNPGWYLVKAKSRIVGRVEGHLKKWWDAVNGLRRPEKRSRSRCVIADYLQLSLLWGGRKNELLSLPESQERRLCLVAPDVVMGASDKYRPENLSESAVARLFAATDAQVRNFVEAGNWASFCEGYGHIGAHPMAWELVPFGLIVVHEGKNRAAVFAKYNRPIAYEVRLNLYGNACHSVSGPFSAPEYFRLRSDSDCIDGYGAIRSYPACVHCTGINSENKYSLVTPSSLANRFDRHAKRKCLHHFVFIKALLVG